MKKTAKLPFLTALLFLSIAISAQFSVKARYWNFYYPEMHIGSFSDLVLQIVPEQIKGFIAGVLRITADEYMHIGPSKKAKQNFIAGSFAGNTEIMALLGLALAFEPTHIDSYTVMSQNLAMHLGRFDEAIALIQNGIMANRKSPGLHRLYSAGAYCYGFVKSFEFGGDKKRKRAREIALNYIDAAIKSYKANESLIGSDSNDLFARLDNYYILKGRFLLDLGKKEEAYQAWQKIKDKHNDTLLGKFFSMYGKGIEVPDLPEQLFTDEFMLWFEQNYGNKSATAYMPGIYGDYLEEAETEFKQTFDRFYPAGNLEKQAMAIVVPDKISAPDKEEKHAIGHQHQEHRHDDHSQCHACTDSAWDLMKQASGALTQALVMLALAAFLQKFVR